MAEPFEFLVQPTITEAPPEITVPKPPPPWDPPPPPDLGPETPADVIGPHAPGALGNITWLTSLLGILALIGLGSALNDVFNWLFRFMLRPFGRGKAAPQTTAPQFTQNLSNALGNAFGGVDAEIGASFTKLATLHGRHHKLAIKAAVATHQLAKRISRLEGNAVTTHAAQVAAQHANTVTRQQATHAEQQTVVLSHQVAADQQGTTARLTALERHITTLIEPELEGLRAAIPALQKGAATAWDEIVKHENLLGEAAMTAAVAGGIGALGASWIECEANKLLGKAACQSGPSNIKRLLEGLFDIAAILNLCQLVTLLVDVAESEEVTDVFTTLTNGIQDLIDCRGIKVKEGLKQTRYAQPGVLTGYALPGVLG